MSVTNKTATQITDGEIEEWSDITSLKLNRFSLAAISLHIIDTSAPGASVMLQSHSPDCFPAQGTKNNGFFCGNIRRGGAAQEANS